MSAAITEFWVYFVINHDLFTVKDFLSSSQQEDIYTIALLTPNCLDGEQLILDASRISYLILSNKDTYIKELTKRYKETFKLGNKQLAYLHILNIDRFDRS